jgi:membrane fusion protein, multidrug efflux system
MEIINHKDHLAPFSRPALVAAGLLSFIIAGSIIISTALAKKGQAAAQIVEPAGVPVKTAGVTVETVPLQVSAIGTVQAYSTVSVKSEVDGELMKVYFSEGQYVKKGASLFAIDPRPAQADFDMSRANQSKAVAQQRQAEANMVRDAAQAKTAEVEAQRYESLFRDGVVSKEQYDQMRTNADALAAVVKADQAAIATERESVSAARAAVDSSRLQLGYHTIRSPIDGRTGSLVVNQGNIVKAADTTPLVVINQVNPIYVSFAVPESQLVGIKRYMAQGGLKVAATIPNDEARPETGVLSFTDNAIDNTTGTVRLKATFDNKQRRLWPGQFVSVVLTLTTQPDAVVVPTQAVQTGQQGQYVFVVKPDQTVESRPVVVARNAGENSVIASGLRPGETVVTDGQLRLRPGSKVRTTGTTD